jgi:hypothetical protein
MCNHQGVGPSTIDLTRAPSLCRSFWRTPPSPPRASAACLESLRSCEAPEGELDRGDGKERSERLAGEQRRRHVETEHPGGRQIDDEIKFGRLLDRDVGRLRSAQNQFGDAVQIVGDQVEQEIGLAHSLCGRP